MTDSAKRHTKLSRIKPRFMLTPNPIAEVSLFGSKAKYTFQVVNFSKSGMLLDYKVDKLINFNTCSILEVWLKHPSIDMICFSAKFVRKESNRTMAFKIIDISPENEENYYKLIEIAEPFQG